MSSNLEQIKSKVSETKNQIEQSRDLSPEEKMAKAREFENVMSEISEDLELLKASATPQELKEIEVVELEYKKLQEQLTVFKQELDDFQNQLQENIFQDIKESEENNNKQKKENKKNWFGRQIEGLTSKDEWKHNTGNNIARVAGGFGAVWLGSKIIKGIGRLFKKKSNNESKTKSTENKPWYKKWRGMSFIGVAGFFGLKTVVGEEKRNNWKERLGIKKSNLSEIEQIDETNGSEELDNPVNEILTDEETTKRNKYIEDSIRSATTIPVVVNYGSDKDILEAKGCPKTIGFDVISQSILFGDNVKLKIETKEFKKDSLTTVTSMKFNSISIVDGKIRFNYSGSGNKLGISGTDNGTADINKDDFIKIIQPHYQENKDSYKVNIPTDEGFDVPVSITATVTNSPQTSPSPEIAEANNINTEIDRGFLKLSESQRRGYNLVGDGANLYMKKLYLTNPSYGSASDVFGGRASAENQFEKYTGTIPSVVDTKFRNVGDFIKDRALDGLNNKAAVTVDKIAAFLEQYKENQYIGSMIGTISESLKNLFSRRETVKPSEITTVFESDPHVKTQVTLMVWKMSVFKLYCKDMEESLKNKLKDTYPNWTDSQINQYIKENFLDKKLVDENNGPSASKTIIDMGLGQELNSKRKFDILVHKKVKELEKRIKKTEKFDPDAEGGVIIYEGNHLKSRGIGTKINLLPNGKYKLSKGKLDLDIEYDSIDELLWTANFLNSIDFKYKKGIIKNYSDKYKNKMWDNVPMLGHYMKEYAPEFVYVNTNISNIGFSWPPVHFSKTGIVTLPDNGFSRTFGVGFSSQVTKKAKLQKEAPTLFNGANMNIFVNHMNTRIRHYDADDTFWGKMKDTFSGIGESINKLRN